MAHVAIVDLNLVTLRGAVDAGTYARGAEYARRREVLYATWDPESDALRGVVRGQENKVYNAAAFFSMPRGLPAEFELGECSCPVEFNCKHVVALVLSALVPGVPGPARPTGPQPAVWEKSLDSLLSPGGSARSGATPLAIELALAGGAGQAHTGKTAGHAPLRLIARLVRPGKNGSWVSGDLSWGRLDILCCSGDHREEQVRLLRELAGAAAAGTVRAVPGARGPGRLLRLPLR
jgi:SWIM zinc finger